jgi:hypothetical protein
LSSIQSKTKFAHKVETEQQQTMVRVAQLAPTTEDGKLLLQDFLNCKTTGFSPFKEKGIGGVDHWRSRQTHQDASQSAFRNQSKKTARIAMAQLAAGESDDGDDDDHGVEEEEHEDEAEAEAEAEDDEDSDNDELSFSLSWMATSMMKAPTNSRSWRTETRHAVR